MVSVSPQLTVTSAAVSDGQGTVDNLVDEVDDSCYTSSETSITFSMDTPLEVADIKLLLPSYYVNDAKRTRAFKSFTDKFKELKISQSL